VPRAGVVVSSILIAGFLLPSAARSAGLLARIEGEVQAIAANLSQSVVTVRAVRVDQGRDEVREVYIGTGVVFDSGWVMTTPSVVARDVRYSVQAPGEVPVPAQLAGFDLEGQTAVLRVPGLRMRPARFRSDSVLVPGQMLLVLGNAYGVESAAGWGMAAGTRDNGLWQVGLNVAPGSSGSPVANTSGDIVGLVVAALSDMQTPIENSSLAGSAALIVPAYRSYNLALRIKSEGSPGRAFLGIRPETVEPGLSKALGLSRGVLIGAVSFGSPADGAGMRAGDVILELDHRPMRHEADLRRVLSEHCPGEQVNVALLRQQQMLQMQITLGQLPELLPDRPQAPSFPGPRADRAAPAPGSKGDLSEQVRALEEQLAELKRRLDDR
jgi:serine protease Do